MPSIINISGKAQHGKDTMASFMKNCLEKENKKVLIFHHADYLKFICKKYFGWDGVKDEKGREILQKVGEKIRRIDPYFFVKITSSFIKVFKDDYDYFLIADVRFKNECDFFKRDYHTFSIEITRDNFESDLTESQKNHISEMD